MDYFMTLSIVLLCTTKVVWCATCSDPCERPVFCSEGDMIPNPEDCQTYFWCVYNEWVVTNCSDDLNFDSVNCTCDFEGQALCAEQCPPTTPRPTSAPGPCEEDIRSDCEEGKWYPDQSDCRYFYICENGNLGERTECTSSVVNPGASPRCVSGLPCVFDIYDGLCINPDETFDCYYRCVTDWTTNKDDVTSHLYTFPIIEKSTQQTTDHLSTMLSSIFGFSDEIITENNMKPTSMASSPEFEDFITDFEQSTYAISSIWTSTRGSIYKTTNNYHYTSVEGGKSTKDYDKTTEKEGGMTTTKRDKTTVKYDETTTNEDKTTNQGDTATKEYDVTTQTAHETVFSSQFTTQEFEVSTKANDDKGGAILGAVLIVCVVSFALVAILLAKWCSNKKAKYEISAIDVYGMGVVDSDKEKLMLKNVKASSEEVF